MRRGVSIGFVMISIVGSLVGCVSFGPKLVESFGQPYRISTEAYQEIIVSNFAYTTYRETSALTSSSYGSGVVYNTYEVLQEYGGGDVSSLIAKVLVDNGLPARAVKDAAVSDLKEGQVLLTGTVKVFNYGSFQMWQIFPFFIGIGNILPAPWGFKVGAQVDYRAELIAADGTVLNQIPGKSARAFYNHYWVWGAIARARADFNNAADIIGPQALGEILSMFGLK
jgi:hypothetical protein